MESGVCLSGETHSNHRQPLLHGATLANAVWPGQWLLQTDQGRYDNGPRDASGPVPSRCPLHRLRERDVAWTATAPTQKGTFL